MTDEVKKELLLIVEHAGYQEMVYRLFDMAVEEKEKNAQQARTIHELQSENSELEVRNFNLADTAGGLREENRILRGGQKQFNRVVAERDKLLEENLDLDKAMGRSRITLYETNIAKDRLLDENDKMKALIKYNSQYRYRHSGSGRGR